MPGRASYRAPAPAGAGRGAVLTWVRIGVRQQGEIIVDTLTSMKVFVTVVEAGSFTSAADRSQLSRAMVSKYVASLEARLGTRLLQRTTRQLKLTESGAAYYEKCLPIIAAVQEAEEGTTELNTTARGTLRLTMPVSFGVLHMGPMISAYLKKYPEMKIDAQLTDRRVDLIEEGLDLAVRIGALAESGLIARKLAADSLVICAAPEYLKRHGVPQHPQDLIRHNCLLYAYSAPVDEWRLNGPHGPVSVKVAGSLRANNGDMVKLAALGGVGLVRQPSFLVGDELRSGRLVEVLPDYRDRDLGIFAVYPSRTHLSAKVRTFVDFAAAAFNNRRDW